MAQVYLLCGKICSGKTTFAQELMDKHSALLLSCDELTKLYDATELDFDIWAERCKRYLLERTADIIRHGVSVVLDWGFWTARERRETQAFFAKQGIATCWYYLEPSEQRWLENICRRNEGVKSGCDHGYFIDEGLLCKLERLFEPMTEAEGIPFTKRA